MQNSNSSNQKVQKVTISEHSDGQRIDNFLFKKLKGVPKSHVYRLLRTGQVRINGKRAKAETKLSLGDEVRIPPIRMGSKQQPLKPTSQAIDTIKQAILLDHADFMVLNKPVGFAVHGGSGVNYGVIDVLRHIYPDDYLELVHRLDKDTSGCLLVAKSRLCLTLLQELWREGQVKKTYLALTVGCWKPPRQTITAPLRKAKQASGDFVVTVDAQQGKDSKTDFEQIERQGDYALMRVTLHTGRMHQIRVHAAYAGHPIVGDHKYGNREVNRAKGVARLYLHAQQLQFVYQGQPFKVEAMGFTANF